MRVATCYFTRPRGLLERCNMADRRFP